MEWWWDWNYLWALLSTVYAPVWATSSDKYLSIEGYRKFGLNILESPAAKTISGERIEVLACVKAKKAEKYIWWQHGSLVFAFKWHQGHELRQRSRVGGSVRILLITGLSGRCLQAESLPLKAEEIADLGDVPRRLGLIISAAVFGFLWSVVRLRCTMTLYRKCELL